MGAVILLEPMVSSMRSPAFLLVLVAVGSAAGCDLPIDPEGTSSAVEDGALRVGVVAPSMSQEDQEAIDAIASSFNANEETVKGAVHDLVAQLEQGGIHILVGDLPASTPLSQKAGLSRAYGRVNIGGESHDRVLAVRKGENGFLTRIEKALPEKRTR